MMPKIYAAIEESVAKGVPPQYISYNLIKAGWPPALVNQALSAWMDSHGRTLHKTDFKAWVKKYQKIAVPSIVIVVIINLIADGIALLKPWPLKVLADSAFGDITPSGFLSFLAPYTHTSTLIAIVAVTSVALFILGAIFGY